MTIQWMGRISVLLLVVCAVAGPTMAQEGAGPPKASAPPGQSGTGAELFGPRTGYVHPFLGITELYSDNVFNSRGEKKTEFTTLVSPGLWLALPRSDVRLLDIQTLNVAPGGLAVSRFEEGPTRRFRSYALYEMNWELFAKHPSENTVNHRAEGLLQYNLRHGISVDVSDQFLQTREPWATGISASLDKYRSNLLSLNAAYDTGSRTRFSLGYSNYRIWYSASRNGDRDRKDHLYRGAVSYRLEPKTTGFLEYEHVDINYDEGVLADSDEDHIFAGLQWDMTAKSRGRVRAGYGIKDSVRAPVRRDLLYEVQAHHYFSSTDSLRITATRRFNESPIGTGPTDPATGRATQVDHILSHSLYSQWAHQFTSKFDGFLNLSYTNDRYEGELSFGGEIKERSDHVYTAGVSVGYEPRRWVRVNLGYEFAQRDSNFADFDYWKNTVFLSANVGI